MSKYINLGTRIRREARDLPKYMVTQGGAGKRLMDNDELNLGIDARFPEHYKAYLKIYNKRPMAWIHIKPKEERFEKDEFGDIQ